MAVPSVPGTWLPLSVEQRARWLAEACERHFARPTPWPADRPTGSVIVLPGRLIGDLSAFLCAMGEAVNGPGGYFGHDSMSLQDCCHGGFGVAPPFILRWEDAAVSRRALGHEAFRAWAGVQLRNRGYLDRDGRDWLIRRAREAGRGVGETLFEHIVAIVIAFGNTVEER
nr:barstar family protein [Pyxidicoccus fallax]